MSYFLYNVDGGGGSGFTKEVELKTIQRFLKTLFFRNKYYTAMFVKRHLSFNFNLVYLNLNSCDDFMARQRNGQWGFFFRKYRTRLTKSFLGFEIAFDICIDESHITESWPPVFKVTFNINDRKINIQSK